MSEFLSRTPSVTAVTSASERGPSVRPQSVVKSMRSGVETGTRSVPGMAERTTRAADYARIQADIADVLARIQPAHDELQGGVEPSERAIVALMPNPVVTLPLPPTDPEIVAFVAQVGQSMAKQAAQTRAAQANATPILIEAAAH